MRDNRKSWQFLVCLTKLFSEVILSKKKKGKKALTENLNEIALNICRSNSIRIKIYLQGVSEIKILKLLSLREIGHIDILCFTRFLLSSDSLYISFLSFLSKPSISSTENENILWMKNYQKNIMECNG